MVRLTEQGFEHYFIDKDGKIYNSNKNFKELKSHPIPQGYLLVVLRNKKISKGFYIHRLLGKYFIPNPNNFPEINHKNKIRNDNRLENIEWVTRKMNNEHRYEYDFISASDKIMQDKFLLNKGIDLYLKNEKTIELCILWNCSNATALDILKRKNIKIKKGGFKSGPNKFKPKNIFSNYIPKYFFLNEKGCIFSI